MAHRLDVPLLRDHPIIFVLFVQKGIFTNVCSRSGSLDRNVTGSISAVVGVPYFLDRVPISWTRAMMTGLDARR